MKAARATHGLSLMLGLRTIGAYVEPSFFVQSSIGFLSLLGLQHRHGIFATKSDIAQWREISGYLHGDMLNCTTPDVRGTSVECS